MYTKTVIFLNLRFSNFYSQLIFKKIKAEYNVRLVAIVDQQFKHNIPSSLSPYLDKSYLIEAKPKNNFLGEFDIEDLRPIVELELDTTNDLRIVCSDEFNLLIAAKLREEFSLIGHLEQELIYYRDKIEMKKKLAENGIRVPKYKHLQSPDTFESLKNLLDIPFILKPIDSCGSHGVKLIHSKDDFTHLTEFENIQIEEFIDGKLYHVDCLMKEEELSFICANEYTYPNFYYTKGFPLGSINLDNLDPIAIKLKEFATQCLIVLGLKKVVNHMEIFIKNNGEMIFLEVSARPPGGLINLLHTINYGINLMDEDFFCQTGLYVDLAHEISPEKAFWAMFPLIPGVVTQLYSPSVEGRSELSWFVQKGDRIHPRECGNVVGKSLQGVFYHPDKTVLRNNFELIKSHQALEVDGG